MWGEEEKKALDTKEIRPGHFYSKAVGHIESGSNGFFIASWVCLQDLLERGCVYIETSHKSGRNHAQWAIKSRK